MLEHIGLEICGRLLLKKRNETLRSLAEEYCCHHKTIHNQYLRFVDTSAEVAKVAAENYYSRTPAHHHDHVGSTAVPGQLSEARGCPAPARKRNTDKAANAAAAQPSLPHGGGAAARAPDASQVAASSVVSAELVRRVKERRPHGNDSSRIIAKLDIDGIFTIEDCTLYGVSDYVKSGWKRADVDVVLLDDRAWASLLCVATAKTPEDFIRGILGSSLSTERLLEEQAKVLCEFQRLGIRSESDLRQKYQILDLPMLPFRLIKDWATSQGSPDIRDGAALSIPDTANGSGLAEASVAENASSTWQVQPERSPRDSRQDDAAEDGMHVTPTGSASAPSAVSACAGAGAVALETAPMRVDATRYDIFDYNADDNAPPVNTSWKNRIGRMQGKNTRVVVVVPQSGVPCTMDSNDAADSDHNAAQLMAAEQTLAEASVDKAVPAAQFGGGDSEVDRGALDDGGGSGRVDDVDVGRPEGDGGGGDAIGDGDSDLDADGSIILDGEDEASLRNIPQLD